MNRIAISLAVTAGFACSAPQAMTGDSVEAKSRGDWVPAQAACNSPRALRSAPRR